MLSSTQRLFSAGAGAGLPSAAVGLQLRLDDRRSPSSDPDGMSNAVALMYKVYGIRQLPAGLGVGHRAHSDGTRRNVETRGIAETTAAGGHSYLRLLLTGTDEHFVQVYAG
jgi:hypothetical protein